MQNNKFQTTQNNYFLTITTPLFHFPNWQTFSSAFHKKDLIINSFEPKFSLRNSLVLELTSPEDRMLFMYSRKPSSLISLSVKMKVIPLPCWPAVRYRNFKSSSKLLTLYDLQYTTQCVILSISSSRFFNVAPRLSSLPFSLYLFLTSYLSLL